jgi:cytidylate kinase
MYKDVALYGKSGSGKSTIAGVLKAAGYQHLRTGAACRRITQDLFGTESKALTNQVTDALRGLDELVWVKRALRDREEGKPAVLDSMRYEADFEFLTALGFVAVKVTASRPMRLQRLSQRGQVFDEARDEIHPTETDLDHYPFAVEVENSGSRDEIELAARHLLGSLLH